MEKKLYRSSSDRMIAGVCGGFADYFGFSDSTWLRLACAIMILALGTGLWLYLICWLIIPAESRP